MDAFFIAFDPLDRVFAVFVLIGALMFLFRIVMNLFVGDHTPGGADTDLGGGGFDHDGGGFDHNIDNGETDTSFRLLTIQGLTSFFLMFGLAGLAMHRGSQAGPLISILVAVLFGVAMMALMAKLTVMMQGLQSSGTIDNRRAIGQTGITYLRIPEGGTGKVQVTIQEHLKTMDAIAANKAQIDTGTRVVVVDVVNDNLLVVREFTPDPAKIA